MTCTVDGQSATWTTAITIYDATPKITGITQYDPDDSGGFYITLWGTNFGPNPGTVAVCTSGSNPCTSTSDITVSMNAPYAIWTDTQVNVYLTPSVSAGGTYDVQITSLGEGGVAFAAAPQQLSQAQSNRQQAQVASLRPTSLKVLAAVALPTGSSGDYGCSPSSAYGIYLDIRYQVLDQNGNALQSSTMTPGESVTFSDGSTKSGNICGPDDRISTCKTATTAADGTFHDAPVGACQNLPISKPVILSQKITMLLSGTSYLVRNQAYTITCPSGLSGSACFDHGAISNTVSAPALPNGQTSDISVTR